MIPELEESMPRKKLFCSDCEREVDFVIPFIIADLYKPVITTRWVCFECLKERMGAR